MKIRISFLRKISQIVAFLLVMYGGFLLFGGRQANLPPVFVVVRAPTDFKEMAFTKNAPPYNQPYNLYLPFKSCRYARGTGLFRGCTYHFFQEILSWRDPIRVWGPYILLFLVLAILLGRFSCGWICPIGFIQDILANIRQRLKLPRLKIGEKTARTMKNVSIGIMLVVLFLSWLVANKNLNWDVRDSFYLSGCQTCPSRIIASLLTGYPVWLDLWRPVFQVLFVISAISLILVVGSLLVNRFWCRVCPNGIILSVFNKGKCLVKEKELAKCVRCGVCANVCSMETTKVYDEKTRKTIDHLDCINCYRCIESCPEKALKLKFFGLKIF